jgi:TetR/AcrR family fatty acid metabolism transcriptional regulator
VKPAREHAAVRERILEAALREFSRSSFHTATIDTITSRAGIAKGTAYLYFRNKRDLFVSLVEHLNDRVENDLAAELARSRGFEARIRGVVRSRLRFFVRNPGIHYLFEAAKMHLSLDEQKHIGARLRSSFRKGFLSIERIVREGVAGGFLQKRSSADLAAFLVSTSNAIALLRIHTRRRLDVERDAELVFELFARGAGFRQHGGRGGHK